MKLISIIDSGHREDTPGKQGNGVREYEFNEEVSRLVGSELSKYGEVYYTIETEKHPYSELTGEGRSKNLNYRTSNANNIYWEAVKKYGKGNFKIVFISIHANAFDEPTVSGYEVFVYKHGSEAHKLAKAIHRQAQLKLGVGTDVKDRGIKEANFAVLKNTIMPAVLIEHEFYTNPIAAKKLLDPGFRKKCSEHILKGVLDYAGITPKKEVEKIIYRVQVGAYSVKENAENMLDKLKKAGFDGYISEEIIKHEDSNEDNIGSNKGESDKPIIEESGGFFVYKDLVRIGSRGDYVKELQNALNKIGYNCSAADGIAGNNTINAIKHFQSDYNLSADGIAGPATYKKLNEVLKTGEKPINKYKILRPDKQSTIVQIKKEFINLVDVIVANTSSGLETLSSMQKRTKVDFIINGGLYWTDKYGKSHSLNLLLDEGKQIQAGVYSKFGLRTFKDNSFEFDWYKWSSNLKDMIGGSPSLVIDGKVNIDGKLDNSLQNIRHPRSVIGEDKDNFYFVTIDGRRTSQGLKGMTINELTKFMLELEVKNAINLDGGGSTKLMFRDEVLNNPSENSRGLNSSVGIKLKEV